MASESKKGECPECGAPIENLRVTCPKCSYEYKESDYTKEDAGHEFTAGSEIDDKGNEVLKEEPEAEGS